MRSFLLICALMAPCSALTAPCSAQTASDLPSSGHAFPDRDTPQITLEVRFLTAPSALFKSLRQQNHIRSAPPAPDLSLPDVSDSELADSGGIRLVSARIAEESHLPVFIDSLQDNDVRKILLAIQGAERGNVMMAPKVTVFNRQTAVICDTTTRPYVVGLKPTGGKNQPQVRTVDDGLQLVVRCRVRTDDAVRVDFRAKLSTVNEVGLMDSGQPDTVIQVPREELHDIQLAAEIAAGETLAVWGVPHRVQARATAGVPLTNNIPYVNRLFRNTGTATEYQEMLILLTPRIVKDTQNGS